MPVEDDFALAAVAVARFFGEREGDMSMEPQGRVETKEGECEDEDEDGESFYIALLVQMRDAIGVTRIRFDYRR